MVTLFAVLYPLVCTQVQKDSIDHRRWTPLMCAVAIQDIDTVRVLLESGVGCNEPFRHNSCKSVYRPMSVCVKHVRGVCSRGQCSVRGPVVRDELDVEKY